MNRTKFEFEFEFDFSVDTRKTFILRLFFLKMPQFNGENKSNFKIILN